MNHINSPIAMALATVIGDKQKLPRGARYSRARNSCYREPLSSRNNNNAPRAAESIWSSCDPRNESMIDDPTDAHH